MNNGLECDVCGGTDFYKESGHYWCNECQTQSQQVQEHVFDQEGGTINKKSSRKIQKTPDKQELTLTSWECYNIVLKNLTDELITLGANAGIKPVVKCLWMAYLRKLQVYSLNKDELPKVSIQGSKKDIQILYKLPERKRRRRRRSDSVSTSTTMSARRQMSGKKRKLINMQYEELSQSQSLTQDSINDTLSSVQSGSELSEASVKIEYNNLSKKEIKNLKASPGDKILWESLRPRFKDLNLSLFTPYSLLYIALLITGDNLQLGDMLRFIREGALTYGDYGKYFEEGAKLNLPGKTHLMFSSYKFRQRTAKVIQFLDVGSYVVMPDLVSLAQRYCDELNLPQQVYECVRKFLLKTQPRMRFHGKLKAVPNYEARAMSMIIFTLKLIFGLDGVTETKFSRYSLLFPGSFNINKWLESILHRQQLLLATHLPSQVLEQQVDSTLFTQSLKRCDNKRHLTQEVQDYLHILERVYVEPEAPPVPTLPRVTFHDDSLEFLLRPGNYLHLAGNKRVVNGGANDNIVKKRWLYLYKEQVYKGADDKKVSVVRIGDEDDLIVHTRDKYINTDAGVYMDNWQQGNAREFLVNKDLLTVGSQMATPPQAAFGRVKTHYNPFERYWLNVPINPHPHCFSRKNAVAILDELPLAFRSLVQEGARVCDQEMDQIFSEFIVTECYLVFVAEFGCKSRTDKKQPKEVKYMAESCKKFW